MFSLRFLLRQLSPFVVRATLAPGRDLCPAQTELLYDQKLLLADHLYLGDLSSSSEVLARAVPQPGTVVFLTGAVDAPLPPEPPEGCTLVLFACSMPKLYNTLSEYTGRIAAWRQEFQALIDRGGGLHATVTLTARLAGFPTLLLDQTGRVVAGDGMAQSTYLASQTAATGALTAQTVEAIFSTAGADGSSFWDVPGTELRIYGCAFSCDGAPTAATGALTAQTVEAIFSTAGADGSSFWDVPGTELRIYGCAFSCDGAPTGMILIESRRQAVCTDLQALCTCSADILCRRLLSQDLDRLGSSSKLFQQCWADIVEQRLTGTADIRDALSHMPYPVDAFVQVGVITFDGSSGIPYNYLLARLREIFPNTNIAVYRKDVVILLSYAQRTFRPELPGRASLTALLERYGGFLALSNGTRKLESLSSMFLLARRTATLGQALRNAPKERIFFHEDYSVYCIIDLCVQRYMEFKGNDDVLYLIHPAVIHLTRYDRDHHSSLRDVLYYYLINDRNLVKTAAATYMHRNTVINKVNKIMELLDLDLEDGNLRQRLILSCQFIRYYENVMKREFRP